MNANPLKLKSRLPLLGLTPQPDKAFVEIFQKIVKGRQ